MVESHATILVHAHPPLTAEHASEHIQNIKRHRAPRPAPESASLTAATARDDLSWRIENKYYTADVGFTVVDFREEDGDTEAPAVIILADRQSDLASLEPVLSKFSSRENEIDVALLISIPSSSSSDTSPPPIDEDAWDDLSLAHGFEWIDVPSTRTAALDMEVTEGNERDLEEKGGISRVVAALHTNMWEGMVPVKKEKEKEMDEASVSRLPKDFDDNEEGEGALGAPPLPEPRPFVPVKMDFPDTFLPSIPRKAPVSATNGIVVPSSAPLEFEDDFAAFVPPSSGSTFPPLPVELPTAPPTTESLYRHPSFAFPDTDAEGGLKLDEEEADDGLDELFAKLKGFREDAQGMDLEERRKLAEAVVGGLGLLE